MTIRITCINKDGGNHENPNVAISHLGWTEDSSNKSGKTTRLQIYDWIKNQNVKAYVRDGDGNTAWVGTAETAAGTKYLRTYSNGVWTDNLLSLLECR